MGIVEAQNAVAVLVVKRKGIPQAVWPLWRRIDLPYFELQEIALLHDVDATVEVQKKRQRMLRLPARHWLSYHETMSLKTANEPLNHGQAKNGRESSREKE